MPLGIRGRVHLVGLVLVAAVGLHLGLSISNGSEPMAASSVESGAAAEDSLPGSTAGHHPEGHGAAHLGWLHLAVVMAVGFVLLARAAVLARAGPVEAGSLRRRRSPPRPPSAHTGSSPVTAGVLLQV
jgi:hypothetical protein